MRRAIIARCKSDGASREAETPRQPVLPSAGIHGVSRARGGRLAGTLRHLGSALLVALAACSSSEDAARPAGGASQSGGGDATGGDASMAPAGEPRAVVIVEAGVDVPWLVPVGPEGAGEPVALGPRRGAGYGAGEGQLAYPQLTPDGTTVVAVFQPLEGPDVLVALAADGSGAAAPVAVATAEELSPLERAYGDGLVAYVDRDLYVAPLDGASPPVLVARAGDGHTIEDPAFVPGGRVAFVRAKQPSGTGSAVLTASTDGSDADAPPAAGGAAPLERLARVLPDGRLLGYRADGRLYAAAVGGDVVALTPEGWLVTLVGASADGAHVVAELRTTWSDGRELVSAATDGSDAATPDALTLEPTADLEAVVSRDGARVAWVGKGTGSQWAVYEAPIVPVPGDQPRRVSAWASQRLHVTDYLASFGALVGANDTAALRFPLPGDEQTAPVVLHSTTVVNHSGPWPVVSADGAHVLFDANTPDGWRSWVVPLAGGTPTEHAGAWYRDLVTPFGILSHEYVTLGQGRAVGDDGAVTELTPWHEAPLQGAFVTEDGAWLVYACEAPAPGFYAARADTTAGPEPAADGAPLLLPPDSATGDWWARRPLYAGGTLAMRWGDVVEGVALDAPEVSASVPLLVGVTGDPLVHPATGLVIAPQGDRVVAVSAKGGPPREVADAGGPVTGVALDSTGDRVLVVAQPGGPAVVLAAAVDGSDAAPLVVGAELPGWLLSLTPLHQRVLSEHSVEATAVPHPDLLLASSYDVAAPETVTVAHAPYVRWGGEAGTLGAPGLAAPLLVTADGAHVLLQGPGGLYSARTDGADATPRLLGPAVTQVGAGLGPDGETVLAAGEGTLTAAVAGQDGSQRVLAEVDAPVVEARFVPTDPILVIYRTEDWTAPGTLWSVPLAGGAPAKLADGAGAIVAVRDDGAVLFEVAATDRGVSVVPAAGGEPVRLTPPDDAGEAFVGWAPSE